MIRQTALGYGFAIQYINECRKWITISCSSADTDGDDDYAAAWSEAKDIVKTRVLREILQKQQKMNETVFGNDARAGNSPTEAEELKEVEEVEAMTTRLATAEQVVEAEEVKEEVKEEVEEEDDDEEADYETFSKTDLDE